ncbi:MAG TPA: hypothetical protein VFL93_16970, partial [Longimicrobiaceae bacterium]|nr:hypothetical protein [Longimicrobiaceae bacterium]
RYPGLLALFTDAAHSEQVWSWTEPVAGVPVYCEASRRPDRLNPRLHWRVAALGTRLEEAEGAQQGGTALADAVAAALLRLIRLRAPGLRAVAGDATVAAHVRARRLIEESGDGAQLRAVWWALRTLRVLDPACGTGEWLLAARAALEPLYVACLERMQSAIDDLRRARTPHRASRLADFRAVLERAHDPARYPGRSSYAREAAVLRNLHGAEPDPVAAATCRARLIAGPRDLASLPALACRVCAGPLVAARDRALPPALAEEAEAAGRADHMLRWMRLEQDLSTGALAEGLAAVEARRARIRAALGGAADPRVDFHDVLARGGFHLVREAERG